MSNIFDIRAYAPSSSEYFFFDTNIWMYLYCPLENYNKRTIQPYGQFLGKIIRAKSTIYISSLVLSEFYNAYLRLEFNLRRRKNPDRYSDFKRDFRRTGVCHSLLADITSAVKKQILKLAQRIDDDFSRINLGDLFQSIEKSDFNDSYYATLAAKKEMAIVTNDRDFIFKGSNVRILTANPHLLRKR
ncbi:MAG: type II toxin-antitoxin system VapC family toxin [bacterium]